jgi:hypothetical protein
VRRISKFAGVLAGCVVLGACSSNTTVENFTTDGVTAPVGSCALEPSAFGEAEYLGTEGHGACTIKGAWRITSVEGVRLSQPALVNCAVANSFRTWLVRTVQPAASQAHGEKVTSIDIAASYACRPRNGRGGAKISEHAFGNAIDISGFGLADGRSISVARDYYRSSFLKTVRRDGCGVFRTVLGPGSDSNHSDHLHFDLANRHNGNTYCH